MRRFGKTGTFLLVVLVLAMIGCGSSSPNEPSSVFISPPDDITTSPFTVTDAKDSSGNSVHLAGSLNYGDVLLLSATVFGTKGINVTSSTVAWNSSNNSLLTVSTTLPSGFACSTTFQGCTVLCAGTWDSANIDCIPPASGTAGGPITVTAQAGSVSSTVTVYVHPKIDRVLVNSAPGGCVSLGGTTQLSATVYSGTTVLPSSGPGDVVGPIFWQVANGGVASFAKASANGVLTTTAPGTTTLVASVASQVASTASGTPTISISSSPSPFVTCPVSSIHLYVSGGSATSTTIAPAGTTQLAADVFDSNGTLLASAPISYFSSQPAAATVGAGLVTGVAAGTSSVTAACSGVGCNIGLSPVYSNVVTTTVTGTTSTTIYAAASGGSTLVPITTGSNTAGTAIALPNAANSILFNRSGTKAYIGSGSGVMVFDPVANGVAVLGGTPVGQVIGISPNGNLLVTFNSSTNIVQILDVSSTATIVDSSFSVGATPRVDFSADSQKAYIVAGTTLYSFTSATSPLVPIALSAAANDVSFLPQGSFAFLAGGAPSAITARATCDDSQADSKAVSSTPQLIAAVPNGGTVVAANPPGINVVGVSTTNVSCPPPLVDTAPTAVDFGLGTFTAQQLLVSPDSSKAFLVTNLAPVLAYDLAANTPSAIALANGAQPLNAGVTLDSALLYVGGSDSAVHVINAATGSDIAQVPVSLTPNLLAVRP